MRKGEKENHVRRKMRMIVVNNVEKLRPSCGNRQMCESRSRGFAWEQDGGGRRNHSRFDKAKQYVEVSALCLEVIVESMCRACKAKRQRQWYCVKVCKEGSS